MIGYQQLRSLLWRRQEGRCAACGDPMHGRVEIAHIVRRGRIRSQLGERYLWHGADNYIELNPGKCPAHIFLVHRSIL